MQNGIRSILHLCISHSALDYRLLITQSFDRIEARSFPCRVEPEDHADNRRDADRPDNRRNRYLRWPLRDQVYEPRAEAADADADGAADQAEHDGFDEELEQDVAGTGADGHAQADLARALGDGDEHDV